MSKRMSNSGDADFFFDGKALARSRVLGFPPKLNYSPHPIQIRTSSRTLPAAFMSDSGDAAFMSMSETLLTPFNHAVTASVILSVISLIVYIILIAWCIRKFKFPSNLPSVNFYATAPSAPSHPSSNQAFAIVTNSKMKMATVEEFLNELAREKPIRFSPDQLEDFTRNYATKLGSGGFGVVYKGELPNGVMVAAKVLKGNMDKRVGEQFMAEVGIMARTYHINLVRLYGFCFDPTITALVYEYLENGSLDKYLFNKNLKVEWKKLQEIAIGTAKGIRYLHEECKDKIIHYDIKPANILLDEDFSPKVADFGLSRLCNREDTHVSKGALGTPGYAAPEMWKEQHVTEKCDVYSFGISLFEILGRRRHFDVSQTETPEWFPTWIWQKYEKGQFKEIASVCGIEDDERENAERICKVALWCVQYQPEARPQMSKVVKMLEGEVEISPPVNPFAHLAAPSNLVKEQIGNGTSYSSGSEATSELRKEYYTPTMRKYEIEIATLS